jgi:hypothetical protein
MDKNIWWKFLSHFYYQLEHGINFKMNRQLYVVLCEQLNDNLENPIHDELKEEERNAEQRKF